MVARGEEIFPAENTKVIEICSAAQGEGKGTNAENGPQEEVVALLKADKPVEISPKHRQKPWR